jgi:hypothetical protein
MTALNNAKKALHQIEIILGGYPQCHCKTARKTALDAIAEIDSVLTDAIKAEKSAANTREIAEKFLEIVDTYCLKETIIDRGSALIESYLKER